MAIDRRYLLSRIEEIGFEEQRSIRTEVDAKFFNRDLRTSPSLVSGSAQAIAVGVRRATARIAEETWTIGEKEAPRFAADARRVAKHLRIRMIGFYRQRLMSDDGLLAPEEIIRACSDLSEVLHNICNEMVEDVIYRSRPLPSSSMPGGPDLEAVGQVETPRKIVRQAQCIDLDKLPTMLSEVRSLIGAARIDNTRRRALIHQITAIEAFAERPNPHQAMLLSMVKRLPPALKMVRLNMAGSLVESFIEQPETILGPDG